MQKLLTLLITGAIIYMIFQHNANSLKVPENLIPKTEKNKEESQEEQQLTGTFLEKTLSKVLINVLKNDEGRLLIERALFLYPEPPPFFRI